MEAPIRELVVDDDPRMVRTLIDIFRAKGHSPHGAHSGEEALDLVGKMPFDCVVTDIRMGTMDGLALFRAIRRAGHELPVVFMTAYADEGLIRQGLDEGVLGAITKPFDMERLLAFLNAVRQADSILIADDDPQFGRTLERELGARGFSVSRASDPAALESLPDGRHRVILLDMNLGPAAGLRILREIRRRSETVSVILVAGQRDNAQGSGDEALKSEAHACLDKPVDMDRLLAVLAGLRQARLRRLLEVPAGKGR